MASANTKKMVEMYLAKHPEVITKTREAFSFTYMSLAMTIVFDWMIARDQADGRDYKADCDELMSYFIEQISTIGKSDWDGYFEEVSKCIRRDIGYSPMEEIMGIIQKAKESEE